jgi:mono/diheme cytochrome c family protein
MARKLAFVAMCGFVVFVAAGSTRAQQPSGAAAASAGLFAEAQARRGGALYNENCAQCHRFDLTGGDQAPALIGPSFTLRWTDKPLSALFDYMRTEMPLNSPGGLSPQQNADLLAFVLQKSGYAAGTADLPSTSEALARLRLSTK